MISGSTMWHRYASMEVMKEIPVPASDGQIFAMQVDDEDYEMMSRFNWRADKLATREYFGEFAWLNFPVEVAA